MCAGALVNARVERLVFGAADPKGGFCGSLGDLVRDPRLNHRLVVTAGVLETECSASAQGLLRRPAATRPGSLTAKTKFRGEVSEWLKEHAWKACVGYPPTVGSNPTLSAKRTGLERCRSGRTGRSRKPLTAQAVRGFESHPLRHPAMLDGRGREPPPARETERRNRRPHAGAADRGPKEGEHREADVSTEQPSPQAHARLSRAHAHPCGTPGHRAAPPQGSQAPERLMADVPRGHGTSPGPAAGGQGLGRQERVRQRRDYLRAYRSGRRRGGRLATLFFVPNPLGHARLGITASRKDGRRGGPPAAQAQSPGDLSPMGCVAASCRRSTWW